MLQRSIDMIAAARIKEHILKIPQGQPFSSRSLRSFATTENIRQVLNRLVKAGELKRVTRGVFVKPKYSKIIGEEIMPLPWEIVEAIAKSTGETIGIHGAEAARQLQLSTQVPMRLVFYTSGQTRTLKISSNEMVKLRHANPSYLVGSGTIPGLVISALHYLERENVTTAIIEKIRKLIPSEEFNKTITLIPYMPAWMANIFYRYQQEKMYV
jgi:hypothetical protein